MTEGERWVREALAELRAAGLGPASIARFLADSQRRANAQRAARPALARQARTWCATGAIAWLLPAAVGVKRFRQHLWAGLGWWSLTTLMLDWHLGMVETEAGEPRPLGPADACTLARAWLVPLAATGAGPLVCGAAFASDGLDGALARASAPTRAGRDLEGAVDTAFAAASLRGALSRGALDRQAAALEAGRLLAGTAYAFAKYFGEGEPPNPALAHAARSTAPIRAAGLLAASLGHRRVASSLVAGGALAGVAAVLRAAGDARDTPEVSEAS